MEQLPPWVIWAGFVLAAILGSKVVSVIVDKLFGKSKAQAETEGLRLTNLNAAIRTVEELTQKVDDNLRVISELKEAKIEDDRKIARRDGVIDEQRNEVRSLHEELSEMRIKLRDLEDRVGTLEKENRELVKENLQLKGMAENAG